MSNLKEISKKKPNPFLPKHSKQLSNDSRDEHILFLFNEIDEWYSDQSPDRFDYSFVESLHESYDDNGDLTDNQLNSLQNIYDGWVNK